MKKLLTIMLMIFTSLSWAEERFKAGPLIENYGSNAQVNQTVPIKKSQLFKVAFDVSEFDNESKVNRQFDSLARFLNMHVRAGVEPKNIQLALVVHGKASQALLNDKVYLQRFKVNNPNKDLLQSLMKNQVEVILCGQSAAYYKVENQYMIPGTRMALSAMTAHALLQQQGFSINPF